MELLTRANSILKEHSNSSKLLDCGRKLLCTSLMFIIFILFLSSAAVALFYLISTLNLEKSLLKLFAPMMREIGDIENARSQLNKTLTPLGY